MVRLWRLSFVNQIYVAAVMMATGLAINVIGIDSFAGSPGQRFEQFPNYSRYSVSCVSFLVQNLFLENSI